MRYRGRAVPRPTPFHERTSALNETMLWRHWAGHLVADRYQMSTKREYYAVRVGAGLADTSPLFKYQIRGPDAEAFLAATLLRDVRRCRPGRAQYTMWCDGRGYVVEDGVVLRTAPDEWLLTTVAPHFAWFADRVGRRQVTIDDVTDDYGILAIQGPRSREVLAQLTDDATSLRPFELCHTKLDGAGVIVSRTGYTGDLGYEVWVERADALGVWDALGGAGAGRGLLPYGSVVLHLARLEAGLLLVDVDYRSARYAWTDEQRATPAELGYGWMAPASGPPPRWRLAGLEVDWDDHQRVYRERGLPAPEDHHPVEEPMQVYGGDGEAIGFASSFAFSPILKRHLALARLPRAAAPGDEVALEILIDHLPVTVKARVARLPFYDPPHRSS